MPNNNRGSRKGIGVQRSEYDIITAVLRGAGVQFHEGVSVWTGKFNTRPTELGRRKVMTLAFETTTFFFDTKGRYLGREYMARDECDYFKPRVSG